MRSCLAALAVTAALAVLVLAAPPANLIPNPDQLTRAAASFFRTADKHRAFRSEDIPYIRFVSWHGLPAARQARTRKLFSGWANHLSFERALGRVRTVPDTDGLLQWVDLRDFRWDVPGNIGAAFQAVAERDFVFQEPWVNHEDAEYLRQSIGVKVSQALVEKDIFPVEAIVWGPWLMRETFESDRSPSYYDLLFARKRFGAAEDYEEEYEAAVEYGNWFNAQGQRVPEGTPGAAWKTTEVAKEKRKRKVKRGQVLNFPANLVEWNQAFGIDKVQDFARKQKLDITFGSVIQGGADVPGVGSIVALQNRLAVTWPSPYGAMQTFDAFLTAGKTDYIANAAFLPAEVDDNAIAFDAGELLAYLPNGLQAGLLIDGKGNRAEIAAQKVADNQVEKRLNPGVRTYVDCLICHAPSGGYIMPENLVEKVTEAGVDTVFASREARNKFLGFFFSWKQRVKAYQDPYQTAVGEATREPPPSATEFELAYERNDGAALERLKLQAEAYKKDKGWDGAKLAQEAMDFRTWYDDPVKPADIAALLGVPPEVLQRITAQGDVPRPLVPGVNKTTRLSMINRGFVTPRRTLELDVFKQLGLKLAAQRE